MKIVILLSLVTICLAKRSNGRSAFVFPGQPSPDGRSHNFHWDELGSIGSVDPERSRRQLDKVSSEEPVELSNPNRKDVKIGNFPARGFHGASEKAKQDYDVKEIPEISLSVKSKSPLIQPEEPSYTKNTIQVLEKKEDSSSGENSGSDSENKGSSSHGQSSESALTFNQQEPSSSEENEAPAERQEVPGSSEEGNALSINQEGSSSSGQISEQAVTNNQQESSSSEENAAVDAVQEQSSPSEENSPLPVNQEETLVNEESSASFNNKAEIHSSVSDKEETSSSVSDKVVDKKQGLAEKLGLQPFVVAKFPGFADKAFKKLSFSLRDLDGLRPARQSKSKKANVPGSRPVRGIEFNFSDLKLENSRNNIDEPQGQIKGAKIQRRWKRPVKK